ncbi:MAG: DUF177 domain-containing protein [Dehalococcoidia bacterium]
MEFNVVQLLKEHTGETRDYEIEEEEVRLNDEGDRGVVDGHVRLTRTQDGVLADATLILALDERCARCTRGFPGTLAMHIEEVFFPSLNMESGKRLSPPEDPEAFLIDEHHILDLREPVRQYRWVAEDLAPLCRPDCRGLCPDCGVDLNQQPDHWHEAPFDERWSALVELAGRIEKE